MSIKFILWCLLHFYQSQLLANSTSARFPNYMGIAVIMPNGDNMATLAMFPVKKNPHYSIIKHHQHYCKYSIVNIVLKMYL